MPYYRLYYYLYGYSRYIVAISLAIISILKVEDTRSNNIGRGI